MSQHNTALQRRPVWQTRLALCGLVLAAAMVLGDLAGNALFRRSGPPWTIAVDPGHGGSDLGAVGLVNECDVNLATAQALYDLLDADPNFTPLLTHTGEGGTPAQRAAAANRHGADLLFSIHCNSDSSGDGFGFECYPELPGRTYHRASLKLAKLVCSEMEPLSARLRGENGIRYAYYDSDDQKHIVEASAAANIQENSFGVLEKSKCPALLVEQAFVTNAEDVAALCEGDGIHAAARAYYRAICAYFGVSAAA